MEPLLYDKTELTHQERFDLAVVLETPGFAVIKKLFEAACQQKLGAIIKLNPEDVNYDSLVKSRSLVSRTTNEVCAAMIKSIVMHAQTARIDEEVEKARKALEAGETAEGEDVAKPLGKKFGSFVMKPRKVATQENQ
jgi:hypothetical protein